MIKDKNVILAIGMISLAIAILLGMYIKPTPVFSFLEGLLYGLSLVMNTYTLILIKRKKWINY